MPAISFEQEIRRHVRELSAARDAVSRSDPMVPTAIGLVIMLLLGIFLLMASNAPVTRAAPLLGFAILLVAGLVGTVYSAAKAIGSMIIYRQARRNLRRQLIVSEASAARAIAFIDKIHFGDPEVDSVRKEILRLQQLIIEGHARLRIV